MTMVIDASDRIKTLEIALENALREIANNDKEIRELETKVKSLNERAIAPNLEQFQIAIDTAISPKLVEQVERNNIEITALKRELEIALSEHLGQLQAIAQMLQPLATHEDNSSLYFTHFGKAAMVTLIQKVIQANIDNLNPQSFYDENF